MSDTKGCEAVVHTKAAGRVIGHLCFRDAIDEALDPVFGIVVPVCVDHLRSFTPTK